MARARKRNLAEQHVHDMVVIALAASYERRGHQVFVNPGPVKAMSVAGRYPDVVVMRKRGGV